MISCATDEGIHIRLILQTSYAYLKHDLTTFQSSSYKLVTHWREILDNFSNSDGKAKWAAFSVCLCYLSPVAFLRRAPPIGYVSHSLWLICSVDVLWPGASTTRGWCSSKWTVRPTRQRSLHAMTTATAHTCRPTWRWSLLRTTVLPRACTALSTPGLLSQKEKMSGQTGR